MSSWTMRGALGALLLVAASAATAQNTYSAYFDTDRNPATGCTVTAPGGTFTGAEARVQVSATVGTTPVVTGTTLSLCSAGVFGAGTPVGGTYPVGINNGTAGSDVIEFAAPIAQIFGTAQINTRIGYVAQDASGSDVLFTIDGTGGGTPIVFTGPPIAIPTLGLAGLLLLGVLLAVFAGRVMRKHRALRVLGVSLLLVAGAAWAATIVLDGQIADWSGIPASATDPAGDASNGSSTLDIRAAFVTSDSAWIYGRLDITDMQTAAPVFTSANNTTFVVGTAGTFTVAATGVPTPTLALTSGALPTGERTLGAGFGPPWFFA